MDYENDRGAGEAPRADEDNRVVVLADARSAAAKKLQERADKAREKAERMAQEAAERAAAEAAVNASVEAFARERDVHFVEASNAWWFRDGETGEWTAHRLDAMLNIQPNMQEKAWRNALQDALPGMGRWHRKVMSSFRPQPSGVLNLLSRGGFCPALEGEPHRFFALLVGNLGDNKPENVEHIERLVLAKYNNPGDYTIPALVLADDNGGAGKNTFVQALKTVFGADLVAAGLSMADFTGPHN